MSRILSAFNGSVDLSSVVRGDDEPEWVVATMSPATYTACDCGRRYLSNPSSCRKDSALTSVLGAVLAFLSRLVNRIDRGGLLLEYALLLGLIAVEGIVVSFLGGAASKTSSAIGSHVANPWDAERE